MDNTQKGAGISLIAVIVGLVVYITYVINSEADTDAKLAEFEQYCQNWRYSIENKRAELNARQESLGGQLDLDGRVEAFRSQFNLEVELYNDECGGGPIRSR